MIQEYDITAKNSFLGFHRVLWSNVSENRLKKYIGFPSIFPFICRFCVISMNLYGTPVLKIRTKDRLHITKEPGFMSWATIVAFFSVAFAVNYYLIPDVLIIPSVFLTMCLLFSLNLMETWDFIMDKEENLVILVTRNWYHGFSMKVPEENVKRFPLNCITTVSAHAGFGIDIVKKDGSCTTIKAEKQDTRSLRKLRKEIATFLHLERIEYLEEKDKMFYNWDIDPWSIERTEFHNADDELEYNHNPGHRQSHYEFSRNIKVITGPL